VIGKGGFVVLWYDRVRAIAHAAQTDHAEGIRYWVGQFDIGNQFTLMESRPRPGATNLAISLQATDYLTLLHYSIFASDVNLLKIL
jgi:hypothetical protein